MLTVAIDPRDEENVVAYVDAVNAARALTPESQLEKDERGYWRMIANLRRRGCPEQDIHKFRKFGTYELPEGIDP
jgi:hypothetical protein